MHDLTKEMLLYSTKREGKFIPFLFIAETIQDEYPEISNIIRTDIKDTHFHIMYIDGINDGFVNVLDITNERLPDEFRTPGCTKSYLSFGVNELSHRRYEFIPGQISLLNSKDRLQEYDLSKELYHQEYHLPPDVLVHYLLRNERMSMGDMKLYLKKILFRYSSYYINWKYGDPIEITSIGKEENLS